MQVTSNKRKQKNLVKKQLKKTMPFMKYATHIWEKYQEKGGKKDKANFLADNSITLKLQYNKMLNEVINKKAL